MVEYASTRLMSPSTHAMLAASRAVPAPTQATSVRTSGVSRKSGNARVTMNTPAVTMVAAWISAETGAGPSIASGSQTCSGNCADLPTAPREIRNMIGDSRPTGSVPAEAMPNSVRKSNVPVADHSMTMPATNPRSPSLVIQNALTAARAADGRSYQKPISRYEHSPTSSQKRNIWMKLGASTNPSIENANSEW